MNDEQLNEWCKQNIDDVTNILGKIINRTKKAVEKNIVKEDSKESSKPEREKVIQKEDLLNLKIMLGNAKSVDDFIKNM